MNGRASLSPIRSSGQTTARHYCRPGHHFFSDGKPYCTHCGLRSGDCMLPLLPAEGALRSETEFVTLKSGGVLLSFNEPPAELRAWRVFGAELMPLLERCLAASVEPPDPALLSLQHSLAELLRSPANTPGAQ